MYHIHKQFVVNSGTFDLPCDVKLRNLFPLMFRNACNGENGEKSLSLFQCNVKLVSARKDSLLVFISYISRSFTYRKPADSYELVSVVSLLVFLLDS